MDRLLLPDHPGPETGFHVEQLLALALEHLVHRHAGPARDHARDMGISDLLLQHMTFGGFIGFRDPAFQVRDHAIGEFACPLQIALPLHLFEFDARRVELFLDFLSAGELFLLRLPHRGEVGGTGLEILEFLLQCLQTVPRGLIALLLERLALDLELDDPSVEFVDLLRLRIHLHAQARRGLIDQVDGLVGQEPVGDVAV